ncbi:F-box/FBD/LRR-repeat protein At1g13570 [Linum perenne]
MKPLALSSSISVAGISKLPADVISLILTFLPIKESVRTSILSKQWRHLWRSVPQLVFDEHFAAIHADAELNESSEVMLIIIYQALLVHEGPINKFELAIPGMKCCPQFDQLINSLSAKSVKELFLRIDSYALLPSSLFSHTSLPSSLFSVPNLNSLKLHGFFFEEPTWSVGFSKLTLLELKDVLLPTSFFNDFLPKCPILEELRVFDCSVDQDPVFVTSSVKVLLFHSYRWTIRFVYTPHLSVLSVVEPSREYFYYDNPTCKSDIVSQFGSLPALEQLNLGVQFLTSLSEGYVPYHLPASLHNLKVLEIPRILLGRLNEARVLACLIMSSPNLLKLTIRVGSFFCRNHDEDDYYRRSDDSYGLQELLEESEDQVGVCCLERLEEFNIKNSSGAQLELDLVRFVLAAAPELKRLSIKPKRDLSSGTMLRFLADVTLCKRISMEAEVEYALTNIDEGLNTLDLDHQ